jgi:hypothetical protein
MSNGVSSEDGDGQALQCTTLEGAHLLVDGQSLHKEVELYQAERCHLSIWSNL